MGLHFLLFYEVCVRIGIKSARISEKIRKNPVATSQFMENMPIKSGQRIPWFLNSGDALVII